MYRSGSVSRQCFRWNKEEEEGRGGGFNKISRESKEFVREVFAPRRGGLELGLSEG